MKTLFKILLILLGIIILIPIIVYILYVSGALGPVAEQGFKAIIQNQQKQYNAPAQNPAGVSIQEMDPASSKYPFKVVGAKNLNEAYQAEVSYIQQRYPHAKITFHFLGQDPTTRAYVDDFNLNNPDGPNGLDFEVADLGNK